MDVNPQKHPCPGNAARALGRDRAVRECGPAAPVHAIRGADQPQGTMGVLAAMERSQLEHLIHAASAIADDYELVVIGSQSILGTIPFPPESLIASMEADIYPKNHPELADLIDGSIGEGSPCQ